MLLPGLPACRDREDSGVEAAARGENQERAWEEARRKYSKKDPTVPKAANRPTCEILVFCNPLSFHFNYIMNINISINVLV